jgi:hypothetical protein
MLKDQLRDFLKELLVKIDCFSHSPSVLLENLLRELPEELLRELPEELLVKILDARK